MALTQVADSATIGGTPYYLSSDSTTETPQTDDCMLQVWIDFANMASGDQYRVRIREKINAGTARNILEAILTGAQVAPWISPAVLVFDGWEVEVTKLAGTDRSIAWSLRKAT